jgi:hypothetical protein
MLPGQRRPESDADTDTAEADLVEAKKAPRAGGAVAAKRHRGTRRCRREGARNWATAKWTLAGAVVAACRA